MMSVLTGKDRYGMTAVISWENEPQIEIFFDMSGTLWTRTVFDGVWTAPMVQDFQTELESCRTDVWNEFTR